MATLFKKGTRIFHEKYGAGKVFEDDFSDEFLLVIFDYSDSDFEDSKIRKIKPENLCLLSEAIKIGDRVHSPCYGYGTVKEIQEDEYKKIICIVDFDERIISRDCIAKQYTDDGIVILKEFRDKKIYEPRLSLDILLEELDEEEKINSEHLEELRDTILNTVKDGRKEYGYYKEIRY